ncbi:MAG: nitrite reductase large subunit NirB [Pseudomonadales bacterium]|nr:nitrite reductase large subunit NirB [Pseudomonadales bacterium]
MSRRRIVVVGNGMVGHHFVSRLRAADTDCAITVIGREPRPAYDRVHLSELFADKTPDDLALTTAAEYEALGVDARFGDSAVTIDPVSRQIETGSGGAVAYDELVLATGSVPFVPPIPGADLPNCLVYRTIEDLEQIRAAARGASTGVVVGGGLLGLECANALRNLGLDTHVVEFAPGLMGVQLDSDGSARLRTSIESLGIHVHTSTATQGIERDDAGSLVMQFGDGACLATDLIVFSAGIRPEDSLAAAAGLARGARGGIVVDEHCRTSDPHIYAIGECALYNERVFGLVAPGYRMAEAAAGCLSGQPAPFRGADMSTKLKLLGIDVGSIGDAHGTGDGVDSYTFSDPRRGVYKRLNLSADGSRVVGAVLVGDCSDYDTLLQYYLNGIATPEDPAVLILPQAQVVTLGADQLTAAATICSCYNVSKGSIIESVRAGCQSLAAVKSATSASSGCGGCSGLLKSIVDRELASLGIAADRSLCEHFRFDRQQLYHLCRVEDIRTFRELIARHGSGRGCDVCKPAVASILASLWNEPVLDRNHVALQDTNDTHLANMQKNGTYSVVPRVPGGEITPDKLIAIGRVARKYDLYTKITGGQRIDLFGAQLHELPLIWRELIDAGFETGHAYGKAMRTVKSCVGSTWCRYGVQDSVAMALRIENRYKGLRSPHKIKLAVSGCARECAEARSKDVGVIATENGWNLYVCGNGGMRPRHADLFATDLDDATLIRYIDRILMFYVRTADRLQRTSVWLENLDGGLDYLREVIIGDSLGLGAELETQMEHLVDTYECEWKTTLENPERLKRFRTFVNASGGDENLVFVRERGQRRPADSRDEATLLVKEGA